MCPTKTQSKGKTKYTSYCIMGYN